MGKWDDYKREESERQAKTGPRRCVVIAAEEAVSKTSGKDMIVVTVRPSASNARVKNYFVKGEWFNKNVTQFFDAFPEIGEGNFNLVEWIGAQGAAEFGTDDNGYMRVKWFLSPDRAADLPAFEGELPQRQTVTDFTKASEDDEDLPF